MQFSNSVSRTLRGWLCAAALVVAVAAMVVALPTSVDAMEWGPRIGLTIDPDQIHGGLQFRAADFTPEVWFVPSVEVGAGDDIVTVAGNMDVFYVFGRGSAQWRPYLGGGPAIFFFDGDDFEGETEVGINIVGGMRTGTKSGAFFGEMRIGLIDAPDFKFTAGWMFH
jgi:hypothetical protein